MRGTLEAVGMLLPVMWAKSPYQADVKPTARVPVDGIQWVETQREEERGEEG